jgi:hypothetical protein
VEIGDFGVEVSNLDGLVVLAVHGDIDLVSSQSVKWSSSLD